MILQERIRKQAQEKYPEGLSGSIMGEIRGCKREGFIAGATAYAELMVEFGNWVVDNDFWNVTTELLEIFLKQKEGK